MAQITDEGKAQIKEMAARGVSVGAMARRLGTSRHTIRYWANPEEQNIRRARYQSGRKGRIPGSEGVHNPVKDAIRGVTMELNKLQGMAKKKAESIERRQRELHKLESIILDLRRERDELRLKL